MLKKLALFSLALMLVAPAAFADTYTVGDGGDYATINGAIGHVDVSDGDVLMIAEGDYPETIDVTKQLTLIGQGTVNITGGGAGSIVTVSAANVTLDNLVIMEASGIDIGANPLVAAGAVAGFTMKNCTLTTVDANAGTDITTAVAVAGAIDTWTITNNAFTLEADQDVAIDATAGGAVDAFDVLGNTFTGPSAAAEFGFALTMTPGAVTVDELVFAGNTLTSATVTITTAADGGGDDNDTDLQDIKIYSNIFSGANGVTIVSAGYAAGDTQLFADGNLTITGNNFGNAATDGDRFYAVMFDLEDGSEVNVGNVAINYNSFKYLIDQNPPGIVTAHVIADPDLDAQADAKYNWWGNNTGPNASMQNGVVATVDVASFDSSTFLQTTTTPKPNMVESTTYDGDGDGKIDHLKLEFDYYVDPASISYTDVTVGDYTLTGSPRLSMDNDGDGVPDGPFFLTLYVTEKANMDTGARPEVTYAGTGWKGITGHTAQAVDGFTSTPVDMVVPEVMTIVTGDTNSNGKLDEIVVTFSEPMKVLTSNQWVTALDNVGNDPNAVAYGFAGAVQSSNVVTYLLNEMADGVDLYDSDVLPTFRLNNNGLVQDLNNNNVLTVVNAVDTDYSDGAAPVAVGVVTGDADSDGYIDTFGISYSEGVAIADADAVAGDISAATVENVIRFDADDGDYNVVDGGDVITVTGVNEKTTELISLHPWDTDKLPDLTLDRASEGLTDDAGNAWVAFMDGVLTLAPTDMAPPVLVLAEGMLGTDDLYLTFSEPVDGSGDEINDDFDEIVAADLDLTFTDGSGDDGATDVQADATLIQDGDGTDGIIVVNTDEVFVEADYWDDANDDEVMDPGETDNIQAAVGAIVDIAANALVTADEDIIKYDVTPPTIEEAETMDLDADGYVDHIKLTMSEIVNDAIMVGYGDGSGINTAIAPFITAVIDSETTYTVVGVNQIADVDVDTADERAAVLAAAPANVAKDALGNVISPNDAENDAVLWVMVEERSLDGEELPMPGDTAITPELDVVGDDAAGSKIADRKINYMASVAEMATTDAAGPAIMSAAIQSHYTMEVVFSEALDATQSFPQAGGVGGPHFSVLYGDGQADYSGGIASIEYDEGAPLALAITFAETYGVDYGDAVMVAMAGAGVVDDVVGNSNDQMAGSFSSGMGSYITAAASAGLQDWAGSRWSSEYHGLEVDDIPYDNGYFASVSFNPLDHPDVKSYQVYWQDSLDTWYLLGLIPANAIPNDEGKLQYAVPVPKTGTVTLGIAASTGDIKNSMVDGTGFIEADKVAGLPVIIPVDEAAAKLAIEYTITERPYAEVEVKDNTSFASIRDFTIADKSGAGKGILVSWEAPDNHGVVGSVYSMPIYGVETYEIQRREVGADEWTTVGEVAGGGEQFVHEVSDSSTPYQYRIVYMDSNPEHTRETEFRTVIAYAGGSDFNADGMVNILDFSLFANQYNKVQEDDPTGFIGAYDLNSDGVININDFSLFASLYGTGGAAKIASTVPTTDIALDLSAELDETSSMYYVTVAVDQSDIDGIYYELAYDNSALEFVDSSVSGLAGLNIVREDTEGLVSVASEFVGEAFDGRITLGFKSKGVESALDFDVVNGFVDGSEGLMASTNLGTVSLRAVPTVYDLSQNFPNPFNPTTTIEYQIPQSGHVELDVYNMAGQKVRTLVSETQDASFYKVVWDGRNDSGEAVASGLYFYKLVSGNFNKIEKMTLLK